MNRNQQLGLSPMHRALVPALLGSLLLLAA